MLKNDQTYIENVVVRTLFFNIIHMKGFNTFTSLSLKVLGNF